MSNDNEFTLHLYSDQCKSGPESEIFEVLTWPIVRTTANAKLVKTVAGEIWIGNSQVPLTRITSAELLQALKASVSSSFGALVPVRAAGEGPTPKWRKIWPEAIEVEWDNDEQAMIEYPITRAWTVPVSQIFEIEDGLWVPRWLLEKGLKKREMLKNGPRIYPGWDDLAREIKAAQVRLDTAIEACKARKAGHNGTEHQRTRENKFAVPGFQRVLAIRNLLRPRIDLASAFCEEMCAPDDSAHVRFDAKALARGLIKKRDEELAEVWRVTVEMGYWAKLEEDLKELEDRPQYAKWLANRTRQEVLAAA